MVVINIISTACCRVTNVTKDGWGGEGAGGDGQRKEPYEGNKRNFLDGLESEVLRKPRLNAWGWYAGALHSPRSVKNSKSTRLPKVTT